MREGEQGDLRRVRSRQVGADVSHARRAERKKRSSSVVAYLLLLRMAASVVFIPTARGYARYVPGRRWARVISEKRK